MQQDGNGEFWKAAKKATFVFEMCSLKWGEVSHMSQTKSLSYHESFHRLKLVSDTQPLSKNALYYVWGWGISEG